MQVYTWTAGTDAFTRDQLTDSHQALEDRAALFLSGPLASRPAAASSNDRGFYLDTDNNVLYYSNGTAWTTVNSYAAPEPSYPGDSQSAGVATTAARSDHKHATYPWATGTSSVSTAASAGAANTFSRGDHVHVLADGAVSSTGKLANSIVTADKLASDAVTSAKILNENVTRAKIEEAERIPTGTIFPYVGETAPTGWYLCDGNTAVSPSSALGVLLGTRYGTSGGNNKVPDLRGKFPYGGWDGAAWTASGGASTVTLSESNLAAHTHTSGTLASDTEAAHSHSVGTLAAASTNLQHDHTHDHSHTVTATDPAVAATPSSLNTVWVNVGTGGSYQVGTGYVNGNADPDTLQKTGTWTATSASTSPSATDNALGNHTHTLSGSTATGGSHSHSITSGSTGSTGSATAFSIVPSFVGVNFIIKA